jgi:predicted CXXCH cytochrome family protein
MPFTDINTFIFQTKDNPMKKTITNSRCVTLQRLILLTIVIMLGVTGCYYNQKESIFATRDGVFTKKGRQGPSGSVDSDLSLETNVHFNARYCLECHEKRPLSTGEKFLKYGGDFKKLCRRCHYDANQTHIHPAEFVPSKASTVKIPSRFPLRDGKVTCTTCHNIVVQCRNSREDKILSKGQLFLRGAPHKTRTSLCFQCHNKANYRKYNPHKQLSNKGEVIKQKCFYCHSELPDEKKTGYKDAKLLGNFGAICRGCHQRSAKQPLHARHLRKPSAEVLAQINRMQIQMDMVLPLDQNGSITCVTCHNPHQKGLIPDTRAGAKGAGEIRRHRLAGNMCIKCHPMR